MQSLEAIRAQHKQQTDELRAQHREAEQRHSSELRNAVTDVLVTADVVTLNDDSEAVSVSLNDGSTALVALDVLNVEEPQATAPEPVA